jgi:poly-gamma-glutamate capsule biosynthesis protein CapA/YwtB (metallophosphatase superfamily)
MSWKPLRQFIRGKIRSPFCKARTVESVTLNVLSPIKGCHGLLIPRLFLFRSAAKNIAVLETASINAVSLANNHVLDYGAEALSEMLDRAGIIHGGAGMNHTQASRLATTEVRGRKLGSLRSLTTNPTGRRLQTSRECFMYL